jgi:hypothetical protein
MGMDSIKARIRETIELTGTARQPRRRPLPERDQAASPGWDQAVCTATARLNEGWILPETRCHPAAAEELAVFLCAYGN